MGSVGLQHTPPIINGQEIHTKSTFSVTNPLTQEEIYTCSSASPEDARAAVKAAHVAFQSWSKTTPSQKRTILNKTADILLSKAAILHDLMSQEVACVASWRNVNIFGSVNMLREAASVVTQIKGEVIPADRPGTMTMIFREPVGVIFSMVPWNAPLNLALRGVCLPLACGNSVILKPSEYTPASQRMLVEIFAEAGLPPGVLQFLPTSPADSPAVAEACIRAKEVRRINFTGSTRVGKIIAKLAAEELKQCIFELGGKASFIVREDANIEDAVNAVIFGGLINSGQVCM